MERKIVAIMIIFLLGILNASNAMGTAADHITKDSSYINETVNNIKQSYGFLIPVEPSQPFSLQLKIIQTVNKLLDKGIVVYWVAKDISASNTNTGASTNTVNNANIVSKKSIGISNSFVSSNDAITVGNPTASSLNEMNKLAGSLNSNIVKSNSENLQQSSSDATNTLISNTLKTNTSGQTGTELKKGSYIIPFTGYSKQDSTISSILKNADINLQELKSPLDDVYVYELVKPRILSVNDELGTGFFNEWEDCCKLMGFDYNTVPWESIPTVLNNDDYNLFIWPGGDGDIICLSANQVDIKQFNTIRDFVGNGGGYIGTCYGGYEASNGYMIPFSILRPYFKNLPAWPFLSIIDCKTFRALPGWGLITVKVVDSDNPISFGVDEIVTDCFYAAGPMFLKCGRNVDVVGVIKETDDEDFWYGEEMPINWLLSIINASIPDPIIKAWAKYAIGKPIWVTSKFGSGKVVAFGDHPESTTWHSSDGYHFNEVLPRIEANAIFYATSKGPFKIDIDTPKASQISSGIAQSKSLNADGTVNGIKFLRIKNIMR